MAALSHFLYQYLFLPLATVFAFVSLYLSPLFNSITTFFHRSNKNSGFKDDYQKIYDFPETKQQLGYESDVFKDVSEFPNSETNETEFNFTFKFPTYEQFCKSKEDKVEYVTSTFKVKSPTKTEVHETEDSKEVHGNIEAMIDEEDKKEDLSNLERDEDEINEEEKGDLCNLECDKDETEKTEELNPMKGESDTRKDQFLKELDFTDDSLFQSEKDSISTDSDTLSIGFDHVCYLMNKLVDSYSDGFLTDENFGGEFELDHEMSEENQESDADDSDSDIMEKLTKFEQDQAPRFLSEDDLFHENSYKLFGDSEDSENGDANNLETLREHQELIEQLKLELRKVRDTGLPTILEESDTLKWKDSEPWKIDEKLQREDCMSELHKFYKSYRERMRKFDILTYQKMYTIGYLQKDPLKDPFQCVSRQRHSELQSDVEVIYVGQMCLSWEFLHWQYGKALSLWDSDPRGTRTYNEVAGEFQQFQVLIQRFIENEHFQGPRVQCYIKSRYDLRNLLQVPLIREDKNKGRGRDKDEYCITSDLLVEIVEESIRIFWQFIRADKNCSSMMVKGKKGIQHQELIKDLGDLELLMEVQESLGKKEKKLKDALKGECCILKRFKKKKENDSDKVLYFFSQVDMKLVTRVLNMSRLTTDQLVWCHNKISSISFLHRKIHVDPSILLFPC
ncbi:uncharacterized protein [Solanum lycopersicum]|uniref:uncharacterized protein isoform X2 n=1 Tax=Solanum lycopersicum TaxID=4081 RepID=UPI000532F9E3|nr:uncharacterized protein LOC101267768 isoform X2 [Solanum lycopersicum]